MRQVYLAASLIFIMSSLKFYPLRVQDVRPETADCVSVALNIPQELQALFQFAPGQYLTFKTKQGDEEIRRSYSICAAPGDCELRVAVKKVEGGRFSSWINEQIKVGDVLEVMPPMGKFSPRESDKKNKNYLAIAAGSGITPVMSIMKTVLEENPDSRFTLVYGNRNRHSIIFREAIEALKNKYMSRLSVYHILSREKMDVDLFYGRINAEKFREISASLIDLKTVDEVFLCGPEEMILSLREELISAGMETNQIHLELFSSPDQPKASHEKWIKEQGAMTGEAEVSVTLDGSTFSYRLPYNGDSILDSSLREGADLPYACKGGVCATCRAKLIEGQVEMEVNYALEADEIEKGFILTCQSHPRTPVVKVDFDAR